MHPKRPLAALFISLLFTACTNIPTQAPVTTQAPPTTFPPTSAPPTQSEILPTRPPTSQAAPALDLSQAWAYGGLVVGTVDGPNTLGSLLMPEVFKFPDGVYRLYFNRSEGPGQDSIAYAESLDAVTWEFKGTIFTSDSDPAAPFYIMGGPRLVALPNGQYRMYFRAAPAHTQGTPPLYQTYSALSPDGVNFTLEAGVRISIAPADPNSPFSLAGHGAFFTLPDGTFGTILSADPVGVRGPSDLFLGFSKDGLTWGDFTLLYEDLHDPVVIKQHDQYYVFATLLDKATYVGVSSDGRTWPALAGLMALTFYDEAQADVSAHVGDVGALIAPNNEIWLLSNWNKERRPGAVSTAIAWFRPLNK